MAGGIEYNVFPYEESSRRQLVNQLTFGVTSFDYMGTTIYGKDEETAGSILLRLITDLLDLTQLKLDRVDEAIEAVKQQVFTAHQAGEDLTALQKAIRKGDGDYLQDTFTRTRDIRRQVIEAGQAETAFFLELHALELDEHRVDHRDEPGWIAPHRQIDDEDAQSDADLRRGDRPTDWLQLSILAGSAEAQMFRPSTTAGAMPCWASSSTGATGPTASRSGSSGSGRRCPPDRRCWPRGPVPASCPSSTGASPTGR